MRCNDSDREPAISVAGLRKSYGERTVVNELGFQVAAGECFGLLGHNGAGKTTTIEILEGYLARDSGSVSVLGTDPAVATSEWRERIGIVLQDMDVFPTLTVVETVRMFADLYSSPRSVGETIELVGLGHVESSRVGRLSGGEKRRLDVALGLIGDPELLFLDEPTTGFDPAARRDAWMMIEDLKSLGVTIVLTTHYMDEAQALADRLLVLSDGEAAAEGTTDELIRRFGSATRISFRLHGDDGIESLRHAVDADVQTHGSRVQMTSTTPQHHLSQVLGWADHHGIDLDDLEVQRSSLEDVFLALGDDAATSDHERTAHEGRATT